MSKLEVIGKQEILGKEIEFYNSWEEPLFLAKHVAEWIGYEISNVSKMVKNVDNNEKIITRTKNTSAIFLTEDGLYETLMLSKKEIAKELKREIRIYLKQIRKTGGAVQVGRENEFIEKYFPSFSDDVKLAMTMDLKKQNEELRNELDKVKPLAEKYNVFLDANGLTTVEQFSKNLSIKKLGRNNMYKWLRDCKYLMGNNIPYQNYIDREYFKLKPNGFHKDFNNECVQDYKTMITSKGVDLLLKKLIKEGFIAQ